MIEGRGVIYLGPLTINIEDKLNIYLCHLQLKITCNICFPSSALLQLRNGKTESEIDKEEI